MGKPGRQANFELLRIIAMFMVVILHWNTNSGLLLDVGSPVTGAGVWSLVTESVCIVAVNVYLYGADSSGSGTCRCPFVVGGSQSLPHLEQYFSGAVRTLLVRERLCGAVPVVPFFQRRAGNFFPKADAAVAGGAFVLFLHRKILQPAAVCLGSFRI